MARKPVTRRAMRAVLDALEVPAEYYPEPDSSDVKDEPAGAWAAKMRRKEYVAYNDDLAREVCERVAAGATFTDLAKDPKMPVMATIYLWRRKYESFREAYDAARESAAGAVGRRGSFVLFDPVLADEYCERVEMGETLSSIHADPSMPSAIIINRWKREQPEFLVNYNRAREASAEACEHNAIREVELAHDKDSAAVAKARAEVWRWTSGVRNPKTHGNKLDVDMRIEVGLADRLNAAMARVAGRTIEAQIVERIENNQASVVSLDTDERASVSLGASKSSIASQR